MKTSISQRRLILFLVLSLFAVAQVSWWIIFQVRIGSKIAHSHQEIWNQQIENSKLWYSSHYENKPNQMRDWLESTYPDLKLTDDGNSIEVKQETIDLVKDKTRRTLRMFISEGSFFSIILMVGIVLMYRTLRQEAQMERHYANFLASISHELKTPITALKLHLNALKLDNLTSEERNQVLSDLETSLNRQQNLIERLLQARQMIRPAKSLNLETVNLSKATQDALQYFNDLSGLKNQANITVELEESCYARIIPEHWRIIVSNLLENAVKYSKPGSPIIVQLKPGKKSIKFSVIDKGCGFRNSEKKQIFNPFFRLGDEDTRNTRGSGIGLYLVKEMVEVMNGTVDADSDGKDKGATFTIQLPRVEEKTNV